MNLKDIFKPPTGITLGKGPRWEISAPPEPEVFIRALTQVFPVTALLYLEGNPVPEVAKFLSVHSLPIDLHVAPGTLRPRPEVYYIRASPEVVEGLASLFENHATPELCYHFHVLVDEKVVLQWHDAFGRDPFHVTGAMSAGNIESFATYMGSTYELTSLAV